MSTSLRVLVVEDSQDDTLLLARELERAGYELQYEQVQTAAAMTAALDRQRWDLVIGDYSMPHFSGPAALAVLRERDPDTPFIFLSGTIGEDVAVEAMKAGAQDYLIKGNLRRLIPAIERELRDAGSRRERRRAQAALLERARLAELGSDVGVALTQGGDLRATLQEVADGLVHHLDVSLARLWILDPAESVLELQGSAGLYTDIDGEESRLPLGGDTIGRIAQERRPYFAHDVTADPGMRGREWLAREGITAFAGYPLIVRDRVVGVMAMYARHRLSEFVLQTLATVGDAVAVGIERTRAEEALRRSEERFAKVFRASPIAIAIHTLDQGRFLDVNDAFLRLVGYAREEVVGRTAFDLKIWPDLEDRPDLLERVRSGQTKEVSSAIRVKDGSVRQTLTSLEWLELGGATCLLSMIHDVTESRRLEEQLRQAQKMEAVGRLAAGVAHDFNNLLTVITGYCDLLFGSLEPGDPKRADVEEIRKAADGAATVTRQLLSFSRRQVLQPKVVDVNEVLASTETLLRRLIGEDVELVTSLGRELGTVKVDRGQLEQIIMNLAVNARDAMPEGGKLTIETANAEIDEAYARTHAIEQPGRYVMLAFSDTGVGMDAATRAHIFEPFFTTKDPGKGTGLGLATVYGIVQQSGGFIWVYSEPGHGTTFKIYLPRVGTSAETSEETPVEAGTLQGGETILLVEDAPAVRSVTRQALKRYGYTVLEAESAKAALRLATGHEGPLHLLLTDVVMPSMSGRELSEQVARLRPDARVLYMSGYTDDAVVRHGVLEAGVAFLQKPFTPEALARKVREVLDRPEGV
ncbi:MAG: response regulator [Gemmatimonadota bacterium]